MLKDYYQLTKPGIIYGNALSAVAGFFLASQGHVNFLLLAAMLAGISLVIASGCVFNNYIDRNIDRKMGRTKNRPLVTGAISGRSAIFFAVALGIGGMCILARYTNLLTAGTALAGLFVYVVLYGLGKRGSVYGTIVGSVSGAVPLLVGFCAVNNGLGIEAVILFIIMCLWQMPHFYAIAIYRFDDYAAAQLPVLPVVRGIRVAKLHIVCYIVAFIIAEIALSIFGFAGYTYLAVSIVMGLLWLRLAVQGFRPTVNNTLWARKVFLFSLVTLTTFCVVISVNALVP